MILKSVIVQNFKCIDDSNEFSIEPVTCLIGKNESGKTALLQALYKLKPVVPEHREFINLEYPRRRWSEYQERKEAKPDNVLTTVWELGQEDLAAVTEKLGPGALRATGPDKTVNITVKKGYDNISYWSIDIDEGRIGGPTQHG